MLWILAALALAEPLAGEVTDASGDAIVDATVKITTYRSGEQVTEAKTDAFGHWTATVPRGSYTIEVERDGEELGSRPVFVAPVDGAKVSQTIEND